MGGRVKNGAVFDCDLCSGRDIANCTDADSKRVGVPVEDSVGAAAVEQKLYVSIGCVVSNSKISLTND